MHAQKFVGCLSAAVCLALSSGTGCCAPGSAAKPIHVVCIDPGHQSEADSALEPIGPGSPTMKARVSAGTRGSATEIPEYELNLSVAERLAEKLRAAGIGVVLIRESNDVRVSNAERARLANECGADVYLRIHADADANPSIRGAHTSCMTSDNPWNGALYADSRRLCDLVVARYCSATGFANRGVHPRDDLTGHNWCTIPVCLIEMGFMTNPDEDRLLNDPAMQEKMVRGLCDGILAYYGP